MPGPLSQRLLDTGAAASYIHLRQLSADVAKLADARVSEARDGDIMVVQVHSSASTQANPSKGSPFSLGGDTHVSKCAGNFEP